MNYSKIEKINGKYLKLNINKQTNRIFFEENGNGIPLVCLHTAGSILDSLDIYLTVKKLQKIIE